jgi:uncharacterized protein (TIGR02594 family)
VNVTAHSIARRFEGIEEVEGALSNPQILAWLQHDGTTWPKDDEVAWCSGFASWVCWLLELPRPPKHLRLRARSWLLVGKPVSLEEAAPGFDVVVLKRGGGNQPGPEVTDAQGHVGFLAGFVGLDVLVLGGNQADSVTTQRFPRGQILGIRRLV